MGGRAARMMAFGILAWSTLGAAVPAVQIARRALAICCEP